MKCLPMAALAAGLFAPALLHAETIIPSKIDAVALHPDSAEVTRVAHCHVNAGESTIVLQGLPAGMVEQSIHVSGLESNGLSLRSVTTRRKTPSSSPLQSPSPKEQALIEEQAALRDRLAALATKRRMIQKVADTQPSLEIGTSGGATVSPDFWPSIWAKVADGLEDTDHRIREAQNQLDHVTKALTALQTVDRTATAATPSIELVLDISATKDRGADLKLVYIVGGTDWQPVYSARLRTDRQSPQIELTRRAKITQNTGEDWNDVALTLSTSRLTAATSAASLEETHDATGNSRSYGVKSFLSPAAPLDSRGPVVRRFDFAKRLSAPDTEAVAGFVPGRDEEEHYDASLAIPGRVSVMNDAKAKLFAVATHTTNVELIVRSVPVFDTHAYLQAKFVSGDRIPLLPGEVELYRDGTFIGWTQLEGTKLGDPVVIGFGPDDLVSVERTDLRRPEWKPTVNDGIASIERAFKTTIVNRHAFPIRIEIDDREPAFNDVAIALKELPSMTPPTTRTLEGQRGVLAWSYVYAAGETRDINLAWNVRWPAKLGPVQGSEVEIFHLWRGGDGATF